MINPEATNQIRQAFADQALACQGLGSPFTARLCDLLGRNLDRDTAIGRHILDWRGDPGPRYDSLPLRLCGALNALVINGNSPMLASVYPPSDVADNRLWQAIRRALAGQEEFLLQRLQSAPQTNEIRRSAVLLAGFLTLASEVRKPFVLSELGASAGLNMIWDYCHYQLGKIEWGNPASKVKFAPDWVGPSPPQAEISVVSRAGCDLNPLDLKDQADRNQLLSYIWPDQRERISLFQNAADLAVKHEIRPKKADAINWLEQRLAQEYNGRLHVVYHSIAWQYFPEPAQIRGEEIMHQAGAQATEDAPLAWLRFEADTEKRGGAISVILWPGGKEITLGRADFHGRWVEWRAGANRHIKARKP